MKDQVLTYRKDITEKLVSRIIIGKFVKAECEIEIPTASNESIATIFQINPRQTNLESKSITCQTNITETLN